MAEMKFETEKLGGLEPLTKAEEKRISAYMAAQKVETRKKSNQAKRGISQKMD